MSFLKESVEGRRFVNDHGINAFVDANAVTRRITKEQELKEHNDELLSFYISKTESVLTKEQYDRISNIKLIIDKSCDIYFEIVGRYDLREIINELIYILEHNKYVSDFRSLLSQLIELLEELSKTEYPLNNISDDKPFTMPNSPYYISGLFKERVKNIEDEIKAIIDEIKKLLDSSRWEKETKKLIDDILKRLLPKIALRKRMSSVLGAFFPRSFEIVLYLGSIEKWLPNVCFNKKMLDVYSHELFHAYHYVHMKNTDEWEFDDKSRIVKESLARFIEYKYSLFHIAETDISSDLIRMWNDNNMYDFPYAGAKYLEEYAGLCEKMFKSSCEKGTKKAFDLIKIASTEL